MKGNRMLSGNGRHRRPRQAAAFLAAAGVTGSAIAIPLLAATGASAASGTTWDKVAECESGGSWSANTGNGYYGGLQLSQKNWEKYGGLDYAPSADQASRSQQIAIAEKVLADQGVGVWPTCGLLHGLNDDSGPADVDTGVAGDSSVSSGSDPSSSSSFGAAKDLTKAGTGRKDSKGGGSKAGGSQGSDSSHTDAAKSDKSDNSGKGRDSSTGGKSRPDSGSGSENATSGTGRHRGGSADGGAGKGRTGGTSGSGGRHASRDGGSIRDADVKGGSYVVQPGDSLWAITDSLGLPGGWSELYAENKDTVGTDPGLIYPGQRLDVGVESGEK